MEFGAVQYSTSNMQAVPRGIFLPRELLLLVAEYCDAISLLQLMCVNWLYCEVSQEEKIWEIRCHELGYKQEGSRSRGSRLWRELYVSKMCLECGNPGMYIFNLNGSTGVINLKTSRVSLCSPCYKSVLIMPTWTERKRNGLCKLKKRSTNSDLAGEIGRFLRVRILDLVPMEKKCKKKGNGTGGIEHYLMIES
jgi:hypothetical protein